MPPVRPARRGSTCSASPRRVRPFLLNSPYSADEVWEHLPDEVQQHDHRQGARRLGHRRARPSRGGRLGPAHQHRDAGRASSPSRSVLPARRGDRAIKDASRSPTASAGRTSSSATTRRSTSPLAGARPGARPGRAGDAARPPVAADAPDFVERVDGADARGRRRPAPGQRAARRRHVPDGDRRAREARARRRDPGVGRLASASTAASAPSSARTRRSG